MNNAAEKKNIRFPGVRDGETFEVAGFEFIKFPGSNGETPVVMKDIAFGSRFGNNNDLRASEVLRRMQAEILPKIVEAVGEENLCTVKTDLTTLDGLKPYGVMESKISLVSLDFYRTHVEIFDKYNPDRWWWLADPESANPHDEPWWVLCVVPSGYVYIDLYNCDYGVRPFCILKSDIFESLDN